MNYENHTVLLDNGIEGFVSRYSIDYQNIYDWVGEKITLTRFDEIGNPEHIEGIVVEVLEVAYLDQGER